MTKPTLFLLLAALTAPTARASDEPTGKPSSQPSTQPSSQPSSIPSSIPSSQPSSIPSKQPSRQPSSIPSSRPSSIPSKVPSSQPSSIPSEQPSCTPSMAPTDYQTTHLFYPDWSSGGNGCKNDGAQPAYMSANPSYYMSSSLAACCTSYFGWNYAACSGSILGVCSRALWYPDYEGATGGCIADSNEPSYMTNNAVQYLFSRLEDCCNKHYSWDYNKCAGATSNLNKGMYYPDFSGTENVCKSGGGQPQYMNDNPSIWMHSTLTECCNKNYSWNLANCIGSDPAAAAAAAATASATSGLFYPDWLGTAQTCKADGAQPSYMTTNPTMWMHATMEACCDKNYAWAKTKCMGTSTSSSGVVTTTATGKFYRRSSDWLCVQDCVGASPCGGPKNSWEKAEFDTRTACCATTQYDLDCATKTVP